MNMTLYGDKITIIAVYAVNDGSLVKEKDDSFESLYHEISELGKFRKIMKDSNDRIGKNIDCVV